MKIKTYLIPLLIILFFVGCGKKNQNSEEESMGEGGWQKQPEHIPGIEFESMLTPQLDANDNPTEEITYTHEKAGKFFVHTRFHHIPNGQHWYLCNVSARDQKNAHQGNRFTFNVTNNSTNVWTELSPSLFYGLHGDLLKGNEIYIELYLDGKLYNRIPMRLLSQAELESGNFRKYWEEGNFFEPYGQVQNPYDDYRTSYLRNMEQQEVIQVFPAIFDTFNRYFLIHRETGSNSNFSLSELQRDGNLKSYVTFTSNNPSMLRFVSRAEEKNLILNNLTQMFSITLNLVKSNHTVNGSLDMKRETPLNYDSPDGGYHIRYVNSNELLVFKDGKEYDRKELPEETSVEGVSWSRNGQLAYVDVYGEGIQTYDVRHKELKKVIYEPSASAPQVFYNDNAELIVYTSKKSELRIASRKAGLYFQPQIAYDHFKTLFMKSYITTKDFETRYFERPVKVLEDIRSEEMEIYTMKVMAFGTISGGEYENDTLIKVCFEASYDDKMPVQGYNEEQCELFIVKNDSLIYLSAHGKYTIHSEYDANYFFRTGDYRFYVRDPGYSFDRLAYFTKRKNIFDDGLRLHGFTEPKEVVLAGNKLKRLGKYTLLESITEDEFVELMNHEEYGSLKVRKKDDGSFNILNPDGSVQVYTFDFSEEYASGRGEKLNFKDEYEPYLQRNCWGGSDVEVSILNNLQQEDIRQTGLKYMTKDLYELNPDKTEILDLQYEEYRKFMTNEEPVSFSEFRNDKPVLLWEDGLGRYVAFAKKKYLQPMNCEPMIYTYTNQRRQIQFRFDSSIHLLSSNPPTNNGWSISVRNDSLLYVPEINKTYHRLFWEGTSGYLPPLKKGYVIQTDTLDEFLANQLNYRGLNSRETKEFIEAWKPELTEKPYCFIGFYQKEIIDRYAPIRISPKPDAFFRVLMDFRLLDNYQTVEKPALDTITDRPDYTVVEWGGIKR